MNDKDYSDSIAIVWPVENFPDIEEAHCTIIYLGKISEVDFTKEDVQYVLDKLPLVSPGNAPTTSTDLFGKDNDVPVVLLEPTYQIKLDKFLIESALSVLNIHNASEFADNYRPHVTLTSIFDEAPEFFVLGSPVLWWGNER